MKITVWDEQWSDKSSACSNGWQRQTVQYVASREGRPRSRHFVSFNALPVLTWMTPFGKTDIWVMDEYRAYATALGRNPDLNLRLGSEQLFIDLESLIANQFIVISEKYRRWVRNHAWKVVPSDSRSRISASVGASI
jgi:hypothetical protein